MKKQSLITIIIAAHIVLIVLQIHKHTLFIKNNYSVQECEKKIALLSDKKQHLTQELYALKDRENIKKYAQNNLKMQPYILTQVKKLRMNNDTKL